MSVCGRGGCGGPGVCFAAGTLVHKANGFTTTLARNHYDPAGLLLGIEGPHNLALGDSDPLTHWSHADALGTTLALSGPTLTDNNVLGTYRTDPWGAITQDTSVMHINNQVFTGHQHYAESGLIYMNARFYDPVLGSFLTKGDARRRLATAR